VGRAQPIIESSVTTEGLRCCLTALIAHNERWIEPMWCHMNRLVACATTMTWEFDMGWFSKTDEGFFLATIVPNGEGARVDRYLGVVNGEAIIGANIFRDMFSSMRAVLGARAGAYERALSGARDAALEDMKASARELGADGIVGI